MRAFKVTTTTPDGTVKVFHQKAHNARQASGIVKAFHFPGKPVKARVSAE